MNLHTARTAAVRAAWIVGALMRRRLHETKRSNLTTQHDIKLELDVLAQNAIERSLRRTFPRVALLGEEGIAGDPDATYRWVVDPIDGTVNFAYGIPHACVSIALQERAPHGKDSFQPRSPSLPGLTAYADGYRTLVGVVYDPFTDELWTAIRGEPARLNDRVIRVSKRTRLVDSIVSIGFAKTPKTLKQTLPYFNYLVHRVRKVRIMGAAALGLTYVATGRFDAYIEGSIRLWDIAAGGLILECAGGEFWQKQIAGEHTHRLIATNGLIRRQLRVPEW